MMLIPSVAMTLLHCVVSFVGNECAEQDVPVVMDSIAAKRQNRR